MKKILLIFILFLQNSIHSQTYSLTVSTNTYANLTVSTSLNNGAVWDDPAFTFPIGFTFQLYDTTFNSGYIHPDGSGGVVSQTPIASNSMPTLIPLSSDLIDRGSIANSSLSNISYKLDGIAGSRILKIEWNNAGFFNDLDRNNSSTDFLNFQVWLYETTNIVEFRYGPSLITQPTLVFDGQNGPSVALFPFVNYNTGIPTSGVVLSGNPSSPTANNTANVLFLNGMPSNGTTYRFTPSNLNISEFDTQNNGLTIYPNPTAEILNIITAKEFENCKISINNILGKRVYFSATFSNKIDVSNLDKGVYFVKLENDIKSKVMKFIKK